MFKPKKEANLKRNYFITSSRLKLLHLIIIIFSIFVLLGLIVSIRAPAFIQILCICLAFTSFTVDLRQSREEEYILLQHLSR